MVISDENDDKMKTKTHWWGRVLTMRKLAIAAAAAGLFLAYSILPLTAPAMSNSPDEAANRYFSTLFAETGKLYDFRSANLFLDDLAFPRSMRVVGSFIVPVGFVGLPVLYGLAGKVAGVGVLPFLTPLAAVLGVLGLGLLASHLWGKKIGWVTAAMVALHPIWWYETARTFQPNVLFLTLVIWALYFLAAGPIERRYENRLGIIIDSMLSGLLIGLALAVRPSEVYWLVLGGITLVALFWRQVRLLKVVGAAVISAFAMLPFLLINQSLYGSFFRTGYSDSTAAVTATMGGFGMRLLGPLQPYVFPLGFAPRTAIAQFWKFGVGFLPWWSLLVAAALLFLVWQNRHDGLRMLRTVSGRLAVVAAVISVWLIAFYGSWVVYDNPDRTAVTIGASYLRYWLPVFVMSAVPVAWLAVRAWSKGRIQKISVVVLSVSFVAVSAWSVIGAPGEGLLAIRKELRRYEQVMARIIELTPSDAVVISDRADKFIFPSRLVVQPFRSDRVDRIMEIAAGKRPIYYFGITMPAGDVDWLENERFGQLGIDVIEVEKFGDETLYQFVMSK